MNHDGLFELLVVGLALVATATDVRRGIIPNWLTLPPLLLGPLAHYFDSGMGGLIDSGLGMVACAVVPLLINHRGGMAAGDVKAFAAIGALGGVELGLAAQFLSFVFAAFYALGHIIWNGSLKEGFGNIFFIVLNPVLPRRFRRRIAPALLTRIRLGAAILGGAAVAVAGQHPGLI